MENETLLLERYKILEPLGEGGFSKVVKAFDTKMERVVAIKTIPAGRQTAVRALREAKTVALLNHPNIVTLYEFEQHEESYYLIMEFIEGQSLAMLLEKYWRFPVEMALAITIQVCDALAFAHKNDVIHRDIKPANLRIVPDGRVKVMDFGIARLRSAAKTSGATAEGEIVGTFAYMSPEQTSGEMVDERSDVFSLGVLLYEMVTGKTPFFADTPAGTIYKILNEEPEPVHELDSDISPTLGRVIAKTIAKNPNDRYASADDLKTKLELTRQSTEQPSAVVKNIVDQLQDPVSARSSNAFGNFRHHLVGSVKQYQDTIAATGFATSCAIIALWSDTYLPFFLTDLKVLFPVLAFFLGLFFPPAGLAAIFAMISIGMWQISPYLGALTLACLTVYWVTLGRGFPQIAIIPFLAPALAWLKVPFVFPLIVGFAFGPALAAFLAGFGALTLALAEVIGQLDYAWSISVSPELLRGINFNGQFDDLISLFDYFMSQSWVWGQIAIWSGTALMISATRSFKTAGSYWLALVVGILGLFLGYQLVPMYLNVEYDFTQLFLQPMIFSLIIIIVALLIFFVPTKRRFD